MGKEAAAALVGAGAGTLLTLLATAKKARAAPAPEGIDPAVWDMMISQIEALAQLTGSVDALVATLGGTPAGAEDPFASLPRFISGQVICTIINRGFQLPPAPIPKNKQLVVKALPGNVGWILVGATQADSQNLTVAYPLVPNEGIGLFVQNSDRVWVMAPPPPMGALNDGVAFIVEQG